MKKVKHIIRDIIIFSFSVSGLSYWYRRRMRKEGPLVRVLCFHDITDREWFSTLLKDLQKNYYLLTPQQFHAGDFHTEKINLLLTFDDGYQSWVDVVLPEFQKRDIYGIFFITSGLLDAAAKGEGETANFVHNRLGLTRPRDTLTWSGVQELVASGQIIGGHTRTHARLSQTPEGELQTEVVEDKVRLEHKLGVSICDFAYPFGRNTDISTEAEAAVAGAGYLHQYSAETGWYNSGKDGLICRTLVSRMPFRRIRHWISGGYDLLHMLRLIQRSIEK